MKNIFLISIALAFVFSAGCKSEDKPNEPVATTVAPTTSLAPTTTVDPRIPVVGVWCPSTQGDFSPCNPFTPAVGEVCSKLGEVKVGCKSVECKKSCNVVMNFLLNLVD